MFNKAALSSNPINPKELERIDSSGLPTLERHYLRLMAHCLSCFKQMANGACSGPLPTEQKRMEWFLKQPSLENEEAFRSILLEQFAAAGRYLEQQANTMKTSPLALTLDDLIEASLLSRLKEDPQELEEGINSK